jgi:hypothetical protein
VKVVITAITEVFGLFVEDGSLAIGILVWLAVAAFVFPLIAGSDTWRAPVLFVGLVALLVENVLRSARRHLRK